SRVVVAHTAVPNSVPRSAAAAAAVMTLFAIAPTDESMRPDTSAAGRRDWMSAVSVSTSVAVLIVVAEKLWVVVLLMTTPQSRPACPAVAEAVVTTVTDAGMQPDL